MPSEFHHLFQDEMESGLRALEARSQWSTLAEIQGVNLCSNDYLGLAEHPTLHAAVVEAVRESARVGGTGSRLLSGHARAWNELEENFAQFAGTETALSAAEYLQQDVLAVRAIRPPTVPEGSARLRLSLTCTIAAQELIRLERSFDAWRAQSHVRGSASATVTAAAGRA